MNFRCKVSSCASRPVEAMVWINDIESAQWVADLNMLYAITGERLQTNFEALDSEIVSGLKKNINGDFKRRIFIQAEVAQKEELSYGRASRMDDL